MLSGQPQCASPVPTTRRRAWQTSRPTLPVRNGRYIKSCATPVSNPDLPRSNVHFAGVDAWESLHEARVAISTGSQRLLNTPTGVVGVLRQVEKLWGKSRHQASEVAHLVDIIPLVSHALTQHLDQLKARDIVQAAATIGSLPSSDPMALMRLCEACKGHLGQAPGSSLVSLLNVLSLKGVRPGDVVLAEVLRELEGQLSALEVSHQVSALVSLVRLGVRPTPAWLMAWEDATRTELQGMSCEDLSQAAWALGEIRFSPGPAWMAGFLGATQHRVNEATGAQLAQLLSGLGRLGLGGGGGGEGLSSAWRRAALRAASTRLNGLRGQDLSRLLQGVAELRLQPDPEWVSTAAGHVLAVMHAASARDLLDCLIALPRLSTPPPAASPPPAPGPQAAWAGAGRTGAVPGAVGLPSGSSIVGGDGEWVQMEQSHVDISKSVAGASVTRGVRVENAHPPLHTWCTKAWQNALLSAVHHRLPHFTATGLAQLLIALSQVHATPPHEWAGEYQQLLLSKVEAIGCEELAAVPGALVELQLTPRRTLTAAILSASWSKMSLISDEGLLGMAGALHLLPGGCEDQKWGQAFLHEMSRRMACLTYSDLARLPGITTRLRLSPPSSWWTQLYSAMELIGSKTSTLASGASIAGAEAWPVSRTALNRAKSEPIHIGATAAESLSTQALSDFLWGVSVGGQRPPMSVLGPVMQAAQARVLVGGRMGKAAQALPGLVAAARQPPHVRLRNRGVKTHVRLTNPRKAAQGVDV